MDLIALKDECRGRWYGIYSRLGIDVGPGKHGPCPNCGGTDRFRYDDKFGNGDYFCNCCGAGDGFALVGKVMGLDFSSTLKKIGDIVGMVGQDKTKTPVDDIAQRKNNLRSLYKKSSKLTGSDPVSLYLRGRKLSLTPDNVFYCPECYESETKSSMPAMIAMVHSKDSRPIGIHRTYLSGTAKADIESPKKMMPPLENMAGGAIRLFQPGGAFEKDSLGIAEGIETAIAATMLFCVATWACMSNVMLESFEPPKNIKKIVIFADNDFNYVGQVSAYILAKRLYANGLLPTVILPNQPDFNDELVDGMPGEIKAGEIDD